MGLRISALRFRVCGYPDPGEDLESRTPIMVPYTTIGQFLGTLKGVLLSRSAQGSG